MTLKTGTRLGAYVIEAPLGAGGMGEVFAAHDPRLDRRVALKVLSVADPTLRDRFEREAKAVAALNHPNIVTIYSVEEVDGRHFLTMELVEGRPLSEVIPRGGMPLEQLLTLAIPLADAVSAAHERGITHRDLKPANVMVTKDGRVKVLDFGLAKLKEAAPVPAGDLPTRPVTGAGQIVGTVAYMSPEQAEGRPFDHRSDLFSLGIVLYEMATGERPFKGDTNLSILSSIMRDTPQPVTALNAALPRELGRIIRQCLAKDPDRRSQTAKEVRNALQVLKDDLGSGELTAPGALATPRAPSLALWRRRGVWLAAGLIGLAIGVTAALSRRSPDSASTRVEATFTQLTFQAGLETNPSLSPDGQWFVYVSAADGDEDIYLQSVGGQNAINLTKDSPANDTHPAFSPDGQRIAFRSERNGGGIFVIGRLGESVRRVSEDGFNPAWSPDGRQLIVSVRPGALGAGSSDLSPFGAGGLRSEFWILDVDTAAKRLLRTEPPGSQAHWSPNGQWVAFSTVERPARLFMVPSAGGPAASVGEVAANVGNPVWSPDGRALYVISDRAGTFNVWRMPVDPDTGRATGPEAPLAAPAPAVADLTASLDGRRLAYVSVQVRSNIERRAFDPASGTAGAEGTRVTNASSEWGRHFDLSPDGAWIAFTSGSTVGQSDLYVVRSDGSALQQLTNDAAREMAPRWSPDGTSLVFNSTAGGSAGTIGKVWRVNPDGSGRLQVTNSERDVERPIFSRDGVHLFGTVHEAGETVVLKWRAGVAWGQQQVQRLAPGADRGNFHCLGLSPDERWLACASPRGHFVYSLETGERRQISDQTQGSIMPLRWLDSRRLLLPDGPSATRLLLVDIETRDTREVLSVAPDRLRNFALSPDRRTLYVSRGPEESDIWLAELTQPD